MAPRRPLHLREMPQRATCKRSMPWARGALPSALRWPRLLTLGSAPSWSAHRLASAPAIVVLSWVRWEMTGFLGTVVDAAIGLLVQSILGSFFTGQMEAWTREIGLAEDVQKLRFEMRSVEMVIAAAEGTRIDNKPLARSLDDLKELLYDSEDVMDELDYYRLQQQIEGGCAPSAANPEGGYVSSSTASSAFQSVYNATGLITSWASCGRKRKHEEEGPAHSNFLTFEIKHDIAKRINGIVSHLCTIGNSVQQVLQLEVFRPIARSCETTQNIFRNARLTTSVPIESKVYGRDAERDRIVELLINGLSTDLNVLPVIGIGGVGKTTLARFIYRDKRIRDHFDLQMWVCVSSNFSAVRLTLEILEHVCQDRQEYEKISNFNVLQEILLKNIRNKRFLLVVDDMWEDKDKSGWIKLLAPLKSNQVNGCMVLATTRMKSVVKMIGTMDEVKLSGLDEKEFWLFFKACAFGNENYEGQPRLQSIGKQIAKALKGCPLAARSVGALLHTSISIEHWRTVQEKWESLQEEDDILTILKISYDYLPVCLQRCFAFCSLYPEDHQFNGESLVHTWISLNFVQCEDSTLRLEEMGQQYLDRLVELGFFQKVDSLYIMHDLMHELARKISSNECATIHGLKPVTIRPTVRHLSIITTAFDKQKHGSFPSEKFEKVLQKTRPSKKLRTLMLFGRSSINLLGSLCTLFKEAKCLRFLSVTGADISSINSLLNPCHLRCISVYGDYSKLALPQALTRCYHLQVLDVGTSANFDVPTDMNNLVNLRHLIACEVVHHAIDCVGNMTSLQELKFKARNVGSYEIRQLRSMNELVLLGISQLENVMTKEEAMGARLADKEYIETLSLSWEDNSISLQPEVAKDVLDGLQPHENLKTLKITGYCGTTSPTWLSSTFSVTSLQTLHLENCREWQILPSLEMLPFLRKLKLIRMLNITEISVPSLEELILINMPNLVKCIGSYGMELTSHLRILMIKNCPQMNEFTLFRSYSSFDSDQKSWFPSLNKLSIGHCPNIIKWAILPLREMGVLKELELMDLHVVRELSLPSLEKLVLTKMPNLEVCSGLTASPPLQFLRTLTIDDCPCLIVSHPLPPSALISELSIRGVRTLPTMDIQSASFSFGPNESSVLDGCILALCSLRGITSLWIGNCPNLLSISSEVFSQLIALQQLCIYNCPNLTKSSIMSDVVQGNCMSASSLVLPSLKSLRISTCGITGGWLTQMLPHSQSLETLEVIDCPLIKLLSISQLRETGGTSSSVLAVMTSTRDEQQLHLPYNILCSLKRLNIGCNKDLEFCGGKRDFAGFTSLVELDLYGCPKLVGEFKDAGTVEIGFLSPSLEYLCISHLPEKLQFREGIPYLKKLNLSISSSSCLKSLQLHSLTYLEKLQIQGCEHLDVIEGMQLLTSLRSLDIEMSSELSFAWDLKLQGQEQSGNQIQLLPPSLERLEIWNLTDRVQSRLLSCLPTITKLIICDSPELTSLQLECCMALELLEIRNCESLAWIEGFQSMRTLTVLAVSNSRSLSSCLKLVSYQHGTSEIMSGLKSLVVGDASVLSIPFCKQLTSLTHLLFGSLYSVPTEGMVSLTDEQERALQLLTSLQGLTFLRCPNLLSLPANLHRLTSLERLSITSCQSITTLPDMGLPPSLEQLWLSGCSEELGMQCRIAETNKLSVTIHGVDEFYFSF